MPVTHFFLSATQIGISALAIRADELTGGVGVCDCEAPGVDGVLVVVFVDMVGCSSVPMPDFVIFQYANS